MASNLRIRRILSVHKHVPKSKASPLPGYQRVMAQVEVNGRMFTRHLNVRAKDYQLA